MKTNLIFFNKLFYNRFDITISPVDDVVFDAWPGAVVRNNLLFAAEHIRIHKTGLSLREQIDTFPLTETHPLYKELKEGFPKGYVLTNFSHFDSSTPCGTIRKDETFSFSLLLIGHFNDYRFYFLEAIRKMCNRGFGKPMTPFYILNITENTSSPVRFSDFLQPEASNRLSDLTICFLTPVILYRLKEKKNTRMSYQDKTNRFPGFYQLVRSSFARIQKFYSLYIEPDCDFPLLFDETDSENYLDKAGQPLLKTAYIRYVSLPNARKKEMKNEMPLAGYVGEQVYTGYFEQYLPLLKFMSALGVGNDTVYGMGRFEVEVKYHMNRMDENQKIEVESEEKTLAGYVRLTETDLLEENKSKFVKLSRLNVRFKDQIRQGDIPYYVDAITRRSINNKDRFHQFMLCGNPYVYPDIQLKRINGQATLICIGEGTEHIGGFFESVNEKAGSQLIIDGKQATFGIDSVKAEKIIIQAWETAFTYSIRRYLPLSRENCLEYQKMTDDGARHGFIAHILKSNILFFAQHLGLDFDREVVCLITELEEKAKVKYKNHMFLPFDLKFRTNVSLPDYVGLGIGVSHGFGTVARMNKSEN